MPGRQLHAAGQAGVAHLGRHQLHLRVELCYAVVHQQVQEEQPTYLVLDGRGRPAALPSVRC